MNICNKCGRSVEPENDVAKLETLFHEVQGCVPPFYLQHRHIFTVMEGDKMVCEGSPSRAQYLEGQPRDTREDYKYNPDLEQPYREAYKEMLTKRH